MRTRLWNGDYTASTFRRYHRSWHKSKENLATVFKPQRTRRCTKAEERGLEPRQLEKVLGVPQPRVSELLNGKISWMTADLLTKYLYRLGREVEMKAKPSRGRAAAIA